MHYYFVDESGDPGLDFQLASSSHFVLALVQLAERMPVSPLVRLRQQLFLSPGFEFKYHQARLHQKTHFFQLLQSLSFRVRAVIVNKARIQPHWRNLSGAEFTVELLVNLVMRASDMDIANDCLIIDGATPALIRALRIRLSEACWAAHRIRPFKKIVRGDSVRDDGLQLADMLAGALRLHAIGIEQDFVPTFASKIADVWVLPEETSENKTPPTILK